uniref:WSC domain-containing protein n=1 Tax=Macrostomum lignano TaxID=282301 RepID=A0A1I8FX62_9PLAT
MQTLSILPLILCCCIALGHSLGAEFGHLGCFVDTATRDINGLVGLSTIGPYSVTWSSGGTVELSSMTLELCSEICAYGKFRYFGLQSIQVFASAETRTADTARQPTATATWPALETPPKSAEVFGRNSVYRQVYNRPDSKYFALADRDYWPFYRTEQPVRSLTECVYRCDADCQAVLFHLDACHLLRFPVLPHELKTVAGKFAIRV